MIILDPDRDGCTLWFVNSCVNENFVSHINGTPEVIVRTLLPYITEYAEVRNQWGNRDRQLVLKDMVYIDNTPLTHPYRQAFNHLGFYIHTIQSKSLQKAFEMR